MAGVRFGDYGVFGEVGRDLWIVTESGLGVEAGVLNIAVGADMLYFGAMRASVSVGVAVLLEEQPFHSVGHTGLFVEIRPTGIRWEMSDAWTFQIDPLTFAVEAPCAGRAIACRCGVPLLPWL